MPSGDIDIISVGNNAQLECRFTNANPRISANPRITVKAREANPAIRSRSTCYQRSTDEIDAKG